MSGQQISRHEAHHPKYPIKGSTRGRDEDLRISAKAPDKTLDRKFRGGPLQMLHAGRLKVDDHRILIRWGHLHQIGFFSVPEAESLVLLGGNPDKRPFQAVGLFKELQDS